MSIGKTHTQIVTNADEARLYDDDNKLVKLAQDGDRKAFSQLFEKHQSRIYGICARFLRNSPEIEDAVQQTFLEAWRCLHRFEGRSRFSTWLTRIAIHTCFGFRRRVKRLIFSDEAQDHSQNSVWSADKSGVDERVDERNRRRAVEDILSKLTQKKRVVFVLSELEGMTAPEVSEILKIPAATVRTRLFHARAEFAKLAKRHRAFVDLGAEGAS